MVISEIVTLLIYLASMAFLPEYFGMFSLLLSSPWANTDVFRHADLTFVLSVGFAWKLAVIVAISALPLYIIKIIQSRISPAASSKLM